MVASDTLQGVTNKGFHWATQSKLLIQQTENIMKENLPCPTNKLIAEIKYRTGLSEKKVSEIVNIFVNREVVGFKTINYKGKDLICMVYIDG